MWLFLIFNKDTMKNKLFIWWTGTGKTYQFFKRYGDKRFLALSPCRQLTYESFMKYGNKNYSILNGEIHYSPENSKWTFAVYESIHWLDLLQYEVIFIDEFHFLSDEDRWWNLYNLIQFCNENWIVIIWATATNNIEDEDLQDMLFEVEELIPFRKAPVKIEISEEDFYKNAGDWMASIVFVRYTPTKDDIQTLINLTWLEESKIRIISASVRPAERLETQLAFANWDISLIISTNVLAQWLNFPAQQVMIYYNPYDCDEIIEQKLGRLWRPDFFGDKDEVYYTSVEDTKIYKKKLRKEFIDKLSNYVPYLGKNIDRKFEAHMMLPSTIYSYKDYKYSLPVIKYLLVTDYLTKKQREELEDCLIDLSIEQDKILNILWI